jgi:hypothetical protein
MLMKISIQMPQRFGSSRNVADLDSRSSLAESVL